MTGYAGSAEQRLAIERGCGRLEWSVLDWNVRAIDFYKSLGSVPILAIYAVPHDLGPLAGNDPAARAAREAEDQELTGVQAAAFEKGVPSARVVRIPHADHYVFRSNEADVVREMNAFLASLK